jgi:hypothetical protein
MPIRWLLLFGVISACDEATSNVPPPEMNVATGASLYAERCASCHGPTAKGSIAPALVPLKQSPVDLRARIVTTMPPGAVGSCDVACGRAIVEFLQSLPAEKACVGAPLATRQLRLLTRREYSNSIRDIFGGGGASCGERTFTWRANGRRPSSVHVAGSFNGWASSVAGGGWAMTLSGDSYSLTRALPNGVHQYKFVIDGQWVTDESNPERVSDGFSGFNSVMTVQCNAPLIITLPPETRPKGYAFDNNAEAGLVTSAHLDGFFEHSAKVAEQVVPGCSPSRTCAEQFVGTLGRKLFRRPLSAEEVGRYASIITNAPDFAAGVKLATRTLLASVHFLYRSELGVERPDGTFKLTGFEVATALSYSLLSTTPDDALLDAAAQGRLETREDVEREARRLLMDPRARQAMKTFATQWLGIERLATVDKTPTLFPSFTPKLRASMAAETPAFFEHVVFESTGRFDELLTSKSSVVDATLARHLGTGVGLVEVPAVRAAGLLGHSSVLTSYAHSDQSSPVKRGVFVREHLLCQEFPVPPANAGGVPRIDPNATTRERFRQHSADPSCRACHQYIDEVGFGFEGFDAIGSARTTENGKPIDTSGELKDVEAFGAGTKATFDTLPRLGEQLAASRRAKTCFATMVFRVTHGRLEADACSVEPLANAFLRANGDVREAFVHALATEQFLNRRSEVTP